MNEAEEFFNHKDKPTFLEDNPKSCNEFDKSMLQQMCWDMDVEDDEIDDLIKSLIEWRTKRAEAYYQSRINSISEATKKK